MELRAFVAIVEEGGLSAAARCLHVSQPSLTQTVRTLERELGTPLLTRTSTGATPTEAGRTLVTEARAVLARYQQAVAAVACHGSTRRWRAAARRPARTPPDLLAKPFADLAKACPDTRISARHLSTAALRAGELDVGLVRENPIGPDIDAAPVVDEPLGVLLAASIVGELAGADGVRLDALAGLDWIGFPRSGSPAWYDQLTGVASGRTFAFAPPNWSMPIPEHVVWTPPVGDPVVRRTFSPPQPGS
jgi:DNA-binding transcriptional LysR family regulator